MQEKKIKAGIVGGTGYTGVELLRLLSRHPNVRVCAITSRKDAGTKVTAMYPSLRGFMDDLVFTTPEEAELTACPVQFAFEHAFERSHDVVYVVSGHHGESYNKEGRPTCPRLVI